MREAFSCCDGPQSVDNGQIESIGQVDRSAGTGPVHHGSLYEVMIEKLNKLRQIRHEFPDFVLNQHFDAGLAEPEVAQLVQSKATQVLPVSSFAKNDTWWSTRNL